MKFILSVITKLGKMLNTFRLIVLNGLFLAIIIGLIAILNSENDTVIVTENTVLQLNFNGEIVEQRLPFDLSTELSNQVLSAEEHQHQYQIDEVLHVINEATKDKHINAILLDTSKLTGINLNHIADIGAALNKFKATGKTVTSVSDNYSQAQYLLASYANKIYLSPQGMVFLPGYSVYRLYFKDLLDNLLITPHIFKVGTYKSYVEPYTEKSMSDATRMANSHWLSQLWGNYIDTVKVERTDISNLKKQSISPTLSELKLALKVANGNSAIYAKQVGLVDELASRLSVIDTLKNNKDESKKEATLITFTQYKSTLNNIYSNDSYKDKVAVIYANGEILSGNQPSASIGGDSLSKLLQQAIDDYTIKAVVLRINSPGGSAFASEKIRQQVLALKASDKKVVVSMGSVAASGGYWIASAADYIYATPTTLTGSIGIFGMYASAEKALNKMGVYNDGVATTPLAGLSPTRALDPELADILQLGIEAGYKEFLQVVSEGRNMSVADVDKVAQGRVWTGDDALQLGLIDQIGNLKDAINKAGDLAELNKEFDTIEIKAEISSQQQMINELLVKGVSFIPQSEATTTLQPLIKILKLLPEQSSIISRFNDPKGQYIYCVMCSIK